MLNHLKIVTWLYCKWNLEIMDEDQKNWNDMTKVMMMVNRKSTDMFNTIHIKDQVRNFKTILKYT